MESSDYYRENEQFGYMSGQEDTWYMEGRTPYNTNFAPVDFDIESEFGYDKLFGTPVAFTKDTIYIIYSNSLMAVELNSFRIKWRFSVSTSSPYVSFNSTILKDKWVYTVVNNTVYAIEDLGDSYRVDWSYDYVDFYPAFITYDSQNLYAQLYKAETFSNPEERKVLALSLMNGEKQWEMIPQNGLNLSMTAGDNRLFLLGQHVTTKNLELTGINPATGQVDWVYTIDIKNMPSTQGKPVYFDDILYFTTEESSPSGSKSNIYAINPADGTLLWKHTPISRLDIIAPISVNNDILLYEREYKVIVGLNRTTGAVLWERSYYEPRTTYNNQGRPLLTNRYIFLDDNAKIKIFDVKTGAMVKQLYRYQLAPSMTPVIPVMINSDRIIVRAFDGLISIGPKALDKKEYTVKTGDTLYQIARTFKTSIEYLAKLNELYSPYTLMPGQVLTVPDVQTGYVEHVVKHGDTLFNLAILYNTTVQEIAQANDLTNVKYILTGQTLKIPGYLTHTVKAGESLWTISQKYNVPMNEIMMKNNIPSSGLIYVGQKLVIK